MAVTTKSKVEEKVETIDRALKQIEKSFGEGAIMRMDQMKSDVKGVSTGALSLDLALGGKGLPRGRIIELYGPESSGKTTLALHVAAAAQQEGGIAAVVDAEHALDPTWARKCGVRLDKLLVSQPNSGEEALEITEMLVRSDGVDVIVVDSVAALIPRAEIDGEMGDTHVALQARLMSQAMRKLTAAVGKTRTLVIFINQVRMKIGVMFGNPETTPGGRALKFYSSVRMDVRRVSTIKDAETPVGNHVRVKIVKNKVAAPFREAEFDIMFDSGISKEGDLLDLAIHDNIVVKSGAWFSMGDIRLGQGRENAKGFLRDNPELFKEIQGKILAIRAEKEAALEAELAGREKVHSQDADGDDVVVPTAKSAAPQKSASKPVKGKATSKKK